LRPSRHKKRSLRQMLASFVALRQRKAMSRIFSSQLTRNTSQSRRNDPHLMTTHESKAARCKSFTACTCCDRKPTQAPNRLSLSMSRSF
jgi:hypothetical protein